MLSIIGILLFLPPLFAQYPLPSTSYSELLLPPGTSDPNPIILDPLRQGPYVAVGDGRILRYNGIRFVDYAYTSPNRTKQLCDGVTDVNLVPQCGRPLAFTFGGLLELAMYIVDADGGLYEVIGPLGGRATLLASSANGVPFNFLNGVATAPGRDAVYLLDSSLAFGFTDVLKGHTPPPGDSSGRLIEYNISTRRVRVLLQGLPNPIGLVLNHRNDVLLYSSFTTKQVFKYSLRGPNAGTTQLLLSNLPGIPIKVTAAPTPETFWVAVNVQERPSGLLIPFGYKFNSNGEILVIRNFTDHFPNAKVNIVQEYDTNVIFAAIQRLYIGSTGAPHVGIYDILA